MQHLLNAPLRLSLLLSAPIWCAFIGGAAASCTTDASNNVTCAGANTAPITIYDKAAAFQPTAGSNSYVPANPAFPAASNPNNPGYNPNPQTAIVTIGSGASVSATVTSANRTTALADGGLIVANYSNNENPAVNNVTVNNFGSVSITTSQSTNRSSAIVSDSQVNVFTVNNMAGATISTTQTAFGAFDKTLLSNVASTATPPTPATYTARYNNTTLAITSALYSDDNTNSFIVNNAGTISATGNFAAAYYGRADTTITNSGVLGNAGWVASDTLANGHWSIATFAGADFAILPGSNPDTPIYDVRNISIVNGVYTGTLAVTDTVATTVTNTGTINGDIIVLDTNPLITAAAQAKGQALPLATTGSNSGPRDSVIMNSGTINGALYLGSGSHTIDNAAGGTIVGGINVDQRPSVGTFAAAIPGTVAGTYASLGPATIGASGPCPATGSNTTDPLCAQTRTVLASFVGAQTLTLTNEGTLMGDIRIIDQAASVNTIVLTGTGFSGNVVAVNGIGSNSLTLNGVTNLASVQNFSSIDLMTSRVTVANGVSLVGGANLATTIYSRGGTAASPSTQAGSIVGTLNLAGATTFIPTFTTIVQNGSTYQIASAVTGPGTIVAAPGTALVSSNLSATANGLILTTAVRDARTIAGVTASGGATVNGLVNYTGTNAKVQNLGILVEGFGSTAAVARAAAALSPVVNGADIQVPLATTMLFHQQIDTRLDAFMYAQIPATGRSADLGVPRPVPVYGALPTSGAWIEGIGGGIAQSTLGGVTGYNATLTGVLGGYDRIVAPGLRVGGAFGYLETHINDNVNLATRAGIQTYQGLAYAEYSQPNYYVRGSAGYGGLSYQQTRQISFDNFNDTAFSTHNGNIFTARAEAGVPFEYNGSLLVPYAAFTYNHLTQRGYNENSNNGAGLIVQGATNDSERATVGGKVLVPLGGAPIFSALFPIGSSIALEARAAYMREFGNVAQTVAASFVGAGNVFVATGPTPDRDMLDYGLGLRFGSGAVQFEASYNGVARSTYFEQIGLLRARYVF